MSVFCLCVLTEVYITAFQNPSAVIFFQFSSILVSFMWESSYEVVRAVLTDFFTAHSVRVRMRMYTGHNLFENCPIRFVNNTAKASEF